MQLTTAMLADAAQVIGGKLFVLGGGIDTIKASTFPVIHRALTVAMVAEVSPDERQRYLDISIDLFDEDGRDLGVHATGSLMVGAPRELPPGATSVVPLASEFHNITFPEPKGYTFIVSVEGTEMARVRFWVVPVD
ncbi:MAG: hypothetical protein ACE5GC_01720 [Acidimicrobiia bacterium]